MPYVDLHCHLLPGLDDGARTLADAVRFARRLDAEGVLDVACTSHIKRAHFPRIDIAELAGRREDASARSTPRASTSACTRAASSPHEDALELHDRELQLIAQGPEHAPWLLLECPFAGLDDEFDAAVERLTGLGYGLLLAHPERVRGGARAGSRRTLEAGALLQVNVSSLLGDHGPRAREIAARLVRHGRVVLPRRRTRTPARARSTLPLGYRRAACARRERRPGATG